MTDRIGRLNAALEDRYSVKSEIGEGGMATVYLAEDLRHHRRVALKVLKPVLAAVVGAERFLAEIQTTANLQHPHILPLYDSGEADGLLFYVMPFVEEESLRERLDRQHQLPVDEAIRIAHDVAEALDYAHRRGVIHRDIKPANVLMLDGNPVISDFGIALALGVAGGERLTETGMSLGTPHYMSPEQATGDSSVGAATDIYALGCVLYEMLVGEAPYTGSTPQAILGRIIAGEAPSASGQRPSVPAHVDAAIRKALEKLPADRFTGAQEFGKALADTGFRHGVEVGAVVAPTSRGNRLTLGLAALSGVLAIALVWSLFRPAPQPSPSPPARFRLQIGFESVPGVLPDGSGVVYSEGGRLMLRRWAVLAPSPIPGTEGVAGTASPVLSPTGDEVAFITTGGRLKVAPLVGGVVRTVADSAYCCARWDPDGFIYYSPPARNIDRVPADGGDVEAVTKAEAGPAEGEFQVLPGGEVGVFTVWGDTAHIEAVRLDTGERKVLTPGAVSYVTPTGYLVFGSEEGQILAAPFDADALELTAPPVPVVGGVIVARSYPVFRLSANGTLVYFAGAGGVHFVWLTRSGEVTVVGGGQTFQLPNNPGWRLSPDGKRVAFERIVGGNIDVWIGELSDGTASPLTFSDSVDLAPEWAPDGRSVIYRSGSPGEGGLWSRRVDGTGGAELLFDGFDVSKGIWSPDGTWLVLGRSETTGDLEARDIFGMRPGKDTAAVPLVATDFLEQDPAISRDGRWLAYSSNRTGRDEIFVRPFPNVDDGQWQVSTEGGIQPVWAHNGRELFFVNPVTREMKVAELTTTAGTFRRGRVATLFTVPSGTYVSGSGTGAFYDVSLDDQRFLMAGRAGFDTPEAILVQNFFEELERRVPH